MKKIGYYIVLFLIGHNLYGQDIHWSQYDYNPVFQNPANVGRFYGDYRFHMNYRSQWKSVSVPYSTVSFSAEKKQIYQDFSAGAFFFHDTDGDGKLRTIEFQPSLSYTYKLTPDSVHILRPGIQVGINNRSLQPNSFYYDSQWNGQKFDESLAHNEIFETRKKTNLTIGFGLAYEYQRSKRERINVGIGFFNLNQPNQGFFNEKIERNRRMNLFANAEYKIGFDWDILPSLQLNFQGKYREIVLGSHLRYILIDKLGEYRSFMAGIYYRTGDAFFITAGIEYQNWWAGISYDINTSDLVPASRARGGFEVSIRYILFTFKPKNIYHRVCPDFI